MPLDPQLQTLIDNIPGGIALPAGDHLVARETFHRLASEVGANQPPADLAATEDVTVPGAAGPLAARVYRPHGDGSTTFLFIHGGGFVVGDIASYDFHARTLAERIGTTLISVDYRLAPEDPWPAAADDIESIARWVLDNVADLGGDPARVIVGGDSAGGNLAAVAAQTYIDEQPGFAAAAFFYPAIDLSRDYPSVSEHADGPVLTAEAMAMFGPAYVGAAVERGIDVGDRRISPINFDRLGDMPPTLVVTAGYDVLRDAGQAYAARAEEAGGDVRKLHYPTLPHGFIGLTPFSAACDSAVDEICSAVCDLVPKIGAGSITTAEEQPDAIA